MMRRLFGNVPLCLMLVTSVFLGSKILAIPTPLAQLTIYRVLALSIVPVIVWQIMRQQHVLKWHLTTTSGKFVGILWFWWLWALVSGVWAENIKLWAQTVFLLTLGVSSVTGLYLFVRTMDDWLKLLKGMWLAMTGLLMWGYVEILMNVYVLADLRKIDRWNQFAIKPWLRVPITIFANQNDYGTMMLGYITISLLLLVATKYWRYRLKYVLVIPLASYLIYRTDSRMILLSLLLLLFAASVIYLPIKVPSKSVFKILGIGGLMGVLGIIQFTAPKQISNILYLSGRHYLSGDTVRLNLIRNGFLFLSQTFGMGVGAGNIEHWMLTRAFLPTNGIPNMHNWWMEILVGYGVIVFVLYAVGYWNVWQKFRQITRASMLGAIIQKQAHIMSCFLLVYVLASITSANNLLIEWHWVLMGMFVSFLNIQEQKGVKQK